MDCAAQSCAQRAPQHTGQHTWQRAAQQCALTTLKLFSVVLNSTKYF